MTADVTKVDAKSGCIHVENLQFADDPTESKFLSHLYKVFSTVPTSSARKAGECTRVSFFVFVSFCGLRSPVSRLCRDVYRIFGPLH